MTLREGVELNVVSAKWISGYQLDLTFSDDASCLVDFEGFIQESDQPEIRKYLDVELFKGFTITFGNLMWNDYDLCFSIEDLYLGNIRAFKQCIQSKVAETGSEYGTKAAD